MMTLVEKYHPDLVGPTHLRLASQMEQEKRYRDATRHYVAAGDWKQAVAMYRTIDMWDDAHKVPLARRTKVPLLLAPNYYLYSHQSTTFTRTSLWC